MKGKKTYKFLFTCTGGYGHLHPLMALAQALQQAGHEIAFTLGPSNRAAVEAAGFTFFPITIELATDPDFIELKAKVSSMPLDLAAELYNYPRFFCGVASRLRAPLLMEVAQSWQPDMLIREAGEYAAIIVAERLGIAHAAVAFAASLKGHTIFEREIASQLDPIRQSWGLAPDPTLSALYPYLHLSYSPPSFSLQPVGEPRVAKEIPSTTHFIRTTFFDQAAPESLPDWVADLPPQPTVYVTLGTEVNKEPGLYPHVMQTLITGLRDAPVNLIATLGRDKDPAEFGPQPPNVHIERYIPQSLLLPQCTLMVMHGGSNSLLAGLDLGLPLVVVPLIADQFFNAEIVQKMGLGQVVPLEKLTTTSIRAALDEVLANPAYRNNAGRLQAEMHALPGPEQAVALVEEVIASRQPVLNPVLTASPSAMN